MKKNEWAFAEASLVDGIKARIYNAINSVSLKNFHLPLNYSTTYKYHIDYGIVIIKDYT